MAARGRTMMSCTCSIRSDSVLSQPPFPHGVARYARSRKQRCNPKTFQKRKARKNASNDSSRAACIPTPQRISTHNNANTSRMQHGRSPKQDILQNTQMHSRWHRASAREHHHSVRARTRGAPPHDAIHTFVSARRGLAAELYTKPPGFVRPYVDARCSVSAVIGRARAPRRRTAGGSGGGRAVTDAEPPLVVHARKGIEGCRTARGPTK